MTNHYFIRTICLLTVFSVALQSKANEGKPVMLPGIHPSVYMSADTIPPVKTTDEKPGEEKPVTTGLPVIKEVPKARKQLKPVALPTIPVKPVRIIKPIIKRVGSLIP
jgi:hypothetical protein